MDPPPSPQVPRGPMTRACARALETEVTSLLNELPYDLCKTWLLPHSGMLCVLRYQEDPLGEARNNGQDGKYTDEEAREEEVLLDISSRTSGLRPGHPAPGAYNNINRSAANNSPGPGHPARRPRTSGPRSEIRRLSTEANRRMDTSAWTSGRPAGHPALCEPPDIRPPARTSGT
jgi:hypothetical protein